MTVWTQQFDEIGTQLTHKHSVIKTSTAEQANDAYTLTFDTTTPITDDDVIFAIGESIYQITTTQFARQLNEGHTSELEVLHQPTDGQKTLKYQIKL